ncbi:unnamed protein product [Phytomonas sp. Hart1]|nr:unnamed protein product [Phytomonas sp. Hart1]|eukprot:CCW66562.1 unnamed protein product [Phytomonas sp. isolate Hart1]
MTNHKICTNTFIHDLLLLLLLLRKLYYAGLKKGKLTKYPCMKSFILNSLSCIFSPKVLTTREIIIHRFNTLRNYSTFFKEWAKDYQPSCSVFRSAKFITNRYSNKAKSFLLYRRPHISSSCIDYRLALKALSCFRVKSSFRRKSSFLNSNTHLPTLRKTARLSSEHSNPSASAQPSSSDLKITDQVLDFKEFKVNNNRAAKQRSTKSKNVIDVKFASKNSKTESDQIPTKSSKRMALKVAQLPKEPNIIMVLHTPNSRILTLNICLRKADEVGGLLTKSMARDQNEAASKVLDRIRMLYTSDKTKVSKGRPHQREDILNDCPQITVMGIGLPDKLPKSSSLLTAGQEAISDLNNDVSHCTLVELDTAMPNHLFWKHARLIKLGGEDLTVKYNVPTITSLEVPRKCWVGLPMMCTNIEAMFVQNNELNYEWCICQSDAQNHQDNDLKEGSEKAVDHVHVLSTDPVFIPTEDLLGKTILLRVSPNKSGLWTQVEISPVQEPPPSMARWEQTTQYVSSPSFRVVTYNILHDDYCTSKYSKTHIYPFATDEMLDIENRKMRILQELLMYHSDLICLQECGQKLFKGFLEPALRACGYGAYYRNKTGNSQEGCALFYREVRFEFLEAQTFPLNWEGLTQDHPRLAAQLGAHPEFQEACEKITSIGVGVLLKEVPTGQEVVLGSTHLFYHPNACHIRVLQAYLLLHRLHRMATAVGPDPLPLRPVVLCGDFNFTHDTGGYDLVTAARVAATHVSWEKGRLFWWGCDRLLSWTEEERLAVSPNTQTAALTGDLTDRPNRLAKAALGEDKSNEKGEIRKVSADVRQPLEVFFKDDLHSPFALVDAYAQTDPSMPWTNYTLTFREVIDYIFFSSDSIDVIQTVSIPPESDLSENHAIPNAKYPSDHLALIADLILKQ